MRLSIITLGDVHAEDLAPLTEHFTHLEQLVVDVHPRDPLEKHRLQIHRAIDAASADWFLIVREREQIDAELAKEIAASIGKAGAFRIRTQPMYAGKPLHVNLGEGESRLFAKSHDGPAQAGPALNNPFRAITFASVEEHRAYLAQRQVPHSRVRQTLLFLRDAIGTRTLDRTTLRYIWTEAGFARL